MASRLLLIVEADAYGIPLEAAKVFIFKRGATVTNAPHGVPSGTGLTGATWDDPDAGVQLSAAGAPLILTMDNTGQKYVWMDSADVVDMVVTDNGGIAHPLGQPANVAVFDNYLRTVLPVPQISSGSVPSAVDFKVTWDGTTAVGTTARVGGSSVNNTSLGAAINQVLSDNSKLGPAGSEGLGSPGVSIQVVNIQPNNAALPVLSADYIGKVYAGGVTGTINNGTAIFTDPSANFTSDIVGRLMYIRAAAAGGKDYHGVVLSRTSPTQVTLDRNAGAVVTPGTVQWTVPITLGSHIYGQGGGTRNQGNGHPDDGTLTLQASGSGWLNKGLVDFRNAPNWTTVGFGSELFEIHEISLDANSLADYALVGMGVGTGNAATCTDYTVQGGVVANIGIGNHNDAGGSSDVFHSRFISSNQGGSKSTTVNGPQALPIASLLVASTSNFQNEGYLEVISPAGTQLVHYTSKDATHFLGCIGGTGTAANGAAVKQYAYGMEITLGDAWMIGDFNIVGSHGILVNQSTVANCYIRGGHVGGGGAGGPVIVVAYANRLTLGPNLYIDNIKQSDVGGIWFCPMANSAILQVIMERTVSFNVNDTTFPIVLDGANGGSGTLFKLSGFTNGSNPSSDATVSGAQALPPGAGSLLLAGGGGANPTDNYTTSGWVSVPTDRGAHELIRYTSKDNTHLLGCTGGVGTATNGGVVMQKTILVGFKNAWPAGRGVFIDNWQARSTMGVWASDNATGPDFIGPDIAINDSSTVSSFLATSWKMQSAPTASRPTPTVGGDGSMFYDSTLKRFQHSDGANWAPVQTGRYFTVTGTAGAIAIDCALGDHVLASQPNGGGSTVQAPTHAQAGMRLFIEIKNTSGGAIAIAWNAAFILTSGAWVDPANTKTRNITFRYNGANWIEFARNTADY